MPSRINGIGTAYLGRANVENYPGVCGHCNREVILTDYETGLWFTVLFIPLIPLGRKQILGYCPSCTRHRALPLQAWERVKEETVAESVAELATKRDDPQTAMKTHGILAAFNKTDEAEALATMMQSQFAGNVQVQLYLGAWREQIGQSAAADACFQRAFELEPHHPGAVRAIGIGYIEKGKPDEARRLLSALQPPSEAYDPLVFIMLGRSFQAVDDHVQAMECFQIVLQATPVLAKDRSFRALIRISEKALGAERTVVPRDPFYKSGKFVFATLILVAILALVIVNQYTANHRTLQVLNGLPVELVVKVAGHEQVSVPAGGSLSLPVAEGSHQGQVISPAEFGGAFDFEIRTDWLSRFFASPAFLLDPTQTAVSIWQQAVYSELPNDRSGEFRLRVGELLVAYDDVDFVMENFPDEIRMGTKGSVTKTRVDMVQIPPALVARFSPAPLAPGQELAFLERHLTAAGDETLLAYYVSACHRSDSLARCQQFLARGLQRRPLDVAWHRMYQSVSEMTGDTGGLADRYDRLLAESPADSGALYLRGRLEPTASGAAAYFRRAVAADEGNGFAWAAVSFGRLTQADFDGARDAMDRAVSLQPERTELLARQASILLAQGDFESLRDSLAREWEEDPADVGLQRQYLKVATALGDPDAADAAQRRLQQTATEYWPGEDARQIVLASQLLLSYLREQYDALLEAAEDLSDQHHRQSWRFQGQLALGRLDQAAETGHANRSVLRGFPELCLSLAYRSQNDPQQAELWRGRCVDALAASGISNAYAAELLAKARTQPVTLEQAQEITIEPAYKAAILIELARTAGDGRGVMLDVAGRLNFDPEPPSQFLRRMIEHWRNP